MGKGYNLGFCDELYFLPVCGVEAAEFWRRVVYVRWYIAFWMILHTLQNAVGISDVTCNKIQWSVSSWPCISLEGSLAYLQVHQLHSISYQMQPESDAHTPLHRQEAFIHIFGMSA